MRIEYHRTLIGDFVRLKAFAAALAHAIEPGKTVVADIGAGTGILGLIAERLGAKRVLLYEQGEIAGVARAVLAANKARRCELLPFSSREALEPERVDVVVSETLGNYALEEDIIGTLSDAGRRHLKPGGVMIPRRIRQVVAPVVADRIQGELGVWDRVGAALGQRIDLSPARELSLNNMYVRRLAPAELLAGGGEARVWDDIDLAGHPRAKRQGEARWTARSPASVHGLALWWTAELDATTTLSTAPDAPETHWEQLYLPLRETLSLKPGDELLASIRSATTAEAGTTVAWSVRHTGPDGAVKSRQALDLEKGWVG